ncbi:hypothetical protein [Helicobacter mesocricetorum]|uniref:hypothetical protein n=1 Tax=Helicobacter mesocricetorum TaxID=87012 RepID=UPI000CF06A66|nr:hypothetical protein [Helicobacter mesocricetorum]
MEENTFLKTPMQVSENNLLELMENIILKTTKEDSKVLLYCLNNPNFAFALATNERISFILDNNPLTKIHTQCQFSYPSSAGLKNRLKEIKISCFEMPPDMSKYFAPRIYNELLSFKEFLKNSPDDSINLWIKCLINSFLAPTNTKIPEDMELKEFIVNKYKQIYQNVSSTKLLILNPYIPNFLSSPTELESIFSHKAHLIYYAPSIFEKDRFYKQNFLRMWFFDITEQDLLKMSKINFEQQLNQNFILINKILETGGILYIEIQDIQKMEKFFKIATFYGYKNIQYYQSSNPKNILLLKKFF